MNKNLSKAKQAKNDDFYTQYSDIEAEMNAYVAYDAFFFRSKTVLLPCNDQEWSNSTKYFAANFERFDLKKLISMSYAKDAVNEQLTLFEDMSPFFDKEKHEMRGMLFALTHNTDGSDNINTDDIEFTGYLEGDSDFRYDELRARFATKRTSSSQIRHSPSSTSFLRIAKKRDTHTVLLVNKLWDDRNLFGSQTSNRANTMRL